MEWTFGKLTGLRIGLVCLLANLSNKLFHAFIRFYVTSNPLVIILLVTTKKLIRQLCTNDRNDRSMLALNMSTQGNYVTPQKLKVKKKVELQFYLFI